MAKKVQLKWTDLQREIATLVGEGRTFDELVEMGYTKSVVSKVLNAIKSGQKLPENQERSENVYRELNRKPRTENQKRTKPATQPTSRAGVPTAPVTVGKITITPENWGFTQYGAILVLDTYNKAKRDIDYSGTVGDFICDMCEFYRRILNYTEVEYSRAIGEGGEGAEENGNESPQP